ncbi:MAG TPA: phage portal protein [Candidatus Rokubacteria bacterium]|nr:phage portal protein [Candidatus Rokubacteria bacterium]
MAVVSSYGALTAIGAPAPSLVSAVSSSGPFYDGYRRTYGQIYKQQPAVRTVIDFFARNIAQLGLHAFRRIADEDRVRLTDHDLVKTLQKPNPSTTRYRFIENTVQDIGIYANGYWLKVRTPRRLGLVRLPAGQVGVKGGLLPTDYEWTPPGAVPTQWFKPSEIVHFRMYDPDNPLLGYPPLETLRRVLAEEFAAGEYRQFFWKNAARIESVIERPKDAPKWEKPQRDSFREQWQQFAGSKSGMTPVLEDGMQLKAMGHSAKDSEYLGARKLSREEVAAEYHVPLPMVGILEHATFANIREQHKQLYQDCLGPWLTMLDEEIALQLVPEFEDVEDVYLEFNIAAKMAGSFEEQALSLQTAIGRPYMSPNEGRARLNLPRDPDPESDRIARNLNQTTGAPAPRVDAGQARAVIATFAARQAARLAKVDVDQRAASFDLPRWTRELAADLTPLSLHAHALAWTINRATLALLSEGHPPWTPARVDAVSAWVAQQETAHV